jgi:hypothetical protein
MENKFELNTFGDSCELTIREGKAAPVREKKPVAVIGVISTPALFLHNRYESILKEKARACHVLVNSDAGTITLIVEENEELHDSIMGVISESDAIKNFGINDGDYMDPEGLAEFLRMRKHLFADQTEYANTFTALRSFTAKVNQEIASIKDDQGNYDMKRKQAVEHNVPKSFTISVPLFKGFPKRNIPVEILVNGSLKVTMYSAELIQLTDELREQYVKDTVEKIEQIAPDIVILYQ